MNKRKMKHTGRSAGRLHPDQGNPREVAFAEAWQKENDQGRVLAHLLYGNRERTPFMTPDPSESEAMVAATIIQWLGSNVGMSFLCEVIQSSPEIRDTIEWAMRKSKK